MPSQAEWNALAATIQSEQSCSSCDAKHLKAASGWNSSGNGLDTYGFAALPGGYGANGSFYDAGNSGNWRCASESGSDYACSGSMNYNNETSSWGYGPKTFLVSVRCVKD